MMLAPAALLMVHLVAQFAFGVAPEELRFSVASDQLIERVEWYLAPEDAWERPLWTSAESQAIYRVRQLRPSVYWAAGLAWGPQGRSLGAVWVVVMPTGRVRMMPALPGELAMWDRDMRLGLRSRLMVRPQMAMQGVM